APKASGRPVRRKESTNSWILVGGVVAVVLGAAFVWALSDNSAPAGGTLVFESPEWARARLVQVDGNAVVISKGRKLDFPVSAGKHKVTAQRIGFHDFTKEVQVASGAKVAVECKWAHKALALLPISEAEREGASFALDGRPFDPSEIAISSTADALALAME